MYVSASARGGETARALVDEVSAWASSEGVDALHLYVSTSMPRARAFYVKAGFIADGATLTSNRGDARVFEEMRRDISDFAFGVRSVSPATLYDLRRRVLRGDDPNVEVSNPGDDLASTRHYGGYLGPRVVVSASLYARPAPFAPDESAYQLRYMATDYDVQGKGFGSELLEWVLHDLSGRGASRIWANARVSAVDFYVASGWRVVDNSWHISAETGIEHVVIQRPMV